MLQTSTLFLAMICIDISAGEKLHVLLDSHTILECRYSLAWRKLNKSDTLASSKKAKRDYTIVETTLQCLTMKEQNKGVGGKHVGRRSRRKEGSQKKKLTGER